MGISGQRTRDNAKGDVLMSWIQTYLGGMFDPRNPRASDVKLEDIAHSLALTCRYTGHCVGFFSVAQHCVLMTHEVSDEAKPYALLHDAAEAYIADIARPLKKTLPEISQIENRVLEVIVEAFGIVLTESILDEVHEADNRMLVTEQESIMRPPPAPWETAGIKSYEVEIECWSWQHAKDLYLGHAEMYGIHDEDV